MDSNNDTIISKLTQIIIIELQYHHHYHQRCHRMGRLFQSRKSMSEDIPVAVMTRSGSIVLLALAALAVLACEWDCFHLPIPMLVTPVLTVCENLLRIM